MATATAKRLKCHTERAEVPHRTGRSATQKGLNCHTERVGRFHDMCFLVLDGYILEFAIFKSSNFSVHYNVVFFWIKFYFYCSENAFSMFVLCRLPFTYVYVVWFQEFKVKQLHHNNNNYNYNYNHNNNHYNYTTLHCTTTTTTTTITFQLQLQLQLQLHYAASNHLSVHQWVHSAIHHSKQRTSPIGFLFWNFRHRLVRYYWYSKCCCRISEVLSDSFIRQFFQQRITYFVQKSLNTIWNKN